MSSLRSTPQTSLQDLELVARRLTSGRHLKRLVVKMMMCVLSLPILSSRVASPVIPYDQDFQAKYMLTVHPIVPLFPTQDDDDDADVTANQTTLKTDDDSDDDEDEEAAAPAAEDEAKDDKENKEGTKDA
jgi:hypothetical protein